MSDVLEAVESGSGLLDLSIEKLREYCSVFAIPANKSWKKEDYIQALNDRLKSVELVAEAKRDADANAPAPGHSRVVVHKDPSPNASNRSIFVGVNGRIFQIPRGIEVDIPNPLLEVIKNSTTTHTANTNTGAKNMAEERFETITSVAYPYSVIATTPGEYYNPNDQRVTQYKMRLKFLDKFGKWPTAAELNSAITRGAIDPLN